MKQKQTVCIATEETKKRGYSVPKGFVGKYGFFFMLEQLNEYTANVIKQALETAAEKGICYINGFIQHSDGRQETQCFLDKQSITNTFEETFKKFEV